jgi:chitinase
MASNQNQIMMKKITLLLFIAILFCNQIQSQTEFRVVGYFVNWYDPLTDARNLDYSKVTHLNWAFINPTNATGDLEQPGSPLDTLVARAHAKNVKVLVSLGGGSQTSSTRSWYNTLQSSPSNRALFAHKIVQFVKKYNLDGFDVDLEGDLIVKGPYDEFIKTLSDSLKPQGKLLTAALNGGGTDNFNNSTLAYFDFINIMSYDFTGSWTPNDPGQHASYEHAVQGVTSWAARGATKDQLSVGLPFYAHAFLSDIGMDYENYNVIIGRYPYAYNQDTVGRIVFYNGIPTIKQKTCMAMEKAGGVMIWALQYDVTGSKSLLNAIHDVVTFYNESNTAPEVSVINPTTDTTISTSNIDIIVSANDVDDNFLRKNCYVNGVKVKESSSLTDTFHLANFSAGTYTIIIEAQDDQYKSGYDTLHVTVSNSISRSAYNGSPISIPGIVEVEKYDAGGANVSYKDNTTGNSGNKFRADAVDIEDCWDKGSGYGLGWTAAGEWLEYTVDVADTGYYDFEFRVASTSANRTLNVSVDGTEITGTVTAASTGGWKVWKNTYARNIWLEKGEQIFRLNFLTGNLNINYFKVFTHDPNAITNVNTFSFEVYPNPASEFVYIKLNTNYNSIVEIIDFNGRVLKHQNLESIDNTLDVSDISKGMYIIRLMNNGFTANQRIVIE